LLILFNQKHITQAATAVATEKAAEELRAIVYRGASESIHK